MMMGISNAPIVDYYQRSSRSDPSVLWDTKDEKNTSDNMVLIKFARGLDSGHGAKYNDKGFN